MYIYIIYIISSSSMDDEEEDIGRRHRDFEKEMQVFLKSVAIRRNQKRDALLSDSLNISHVAIEHRLIAAVTFHKNYRSGIIKNFHND